MSNLRNRKLKIAFKDLVGAAGGLEAAAEHCRIGKTTLGYQTSLSSECEDRFAAIDVVACLEELTGKPLVTRMLCQLNGGDFVERPVVPAGRGDLMTLLAAQAREMSELTSALLLGLADGRLCGAEARKAWTEAQQVVAISAQMVAELTVIIKGGDDA